jgi:acetoin utilization protein AcuB
MLVKDYMTRHPIMVDPDMSVLDAQRIMAENKIKHLLIVDKSKRLLGILTPSRFSITADKMSSLDVWEISRRLTQLKVSELMVKGDTLLKIHAEATLEDAAYMIIANRITGLPVVDIDDVVIGIITQSDLLYELYNILGAKEPGWRVTVRVPDRIGEYAKLAQTIYNKGWGLMSMGGVRSPRAPGYWDVVLKISRCKDKQLLINAIEMIDDQEIIDIRSTNVPYQRDANEP